MSAQTLKGFSDRLRAIPRVVAHAVAKRAAETVTEAARSTFRKSEDAYGVPWAPGVEGQAVTLRESGRLFDQIRYVAIGNRLRIALGVAYAKYQIGTRPVFPRQNSPLPPAYVEALESARNEVLRAHIEGGSL